MRLNALTRRILPTWMTEGLGLENKGEVPNQLDTERIVAGVDAFQQGWAVATFKEFQTSQTNTAANTVVIDEGKTLQKPYSIVVLWGECIHTAGAGALDFVLLAYRPPLAGSSSFLFRPIRRAVTNGDSADWQDIYSGRMLWLPPGYALRWDAPLTGVGETMAVRLVYALIPAGFFPLG